MFKKFMPYFIVSLCTLTFFSLNVNAKGWRFQNNEWYYYNNDNEYETETIKASGDQKYYLDETGKVVRDYFLESYGNSESQYYFGSDGAMVKNKWVAMDPQVVENKGDYSPSAFWYYFQSTGKAIKANSAGEVKRATIDGKKYAFNEFGQMLTGWFDKSGTVLDNEEYPYQNAIYYAGGENDGVLHSGWLRYTGSAEDIFSEKSELWFYFNPANNKKEGSEGDGKYQSLKDGIQYRTKKINGRTYAFVNDTGVMLSEWDGYATRSNSWYFSQENDGHRVQKGFVYAVPAKDIDEGYYNDEEEKYMYFNNNGDIVKDCIKKINGKFYAFSRKGLMVNGLNAFAKGRHIVRFDPDETSGKDIAKAGLIRYKEKYWKCEQDKTGNLITADEEKVSIHYFGLDGIRKTGNTEIELSGDKYTFASSNAGHFNGLKSKKYYSNGILLRPSQDLRYGLIVASESMARKPVNYKTIDENGGLFVLNSGSQKVKGSNSAKKDSNGNYWLISKVDGDYGDGIAMQDRLVGIFSVDVKYDDKDKKFYFKSDAEGSGKNAWVEFGKKDKDGKTCSLNKAIDGYAIDPMRDEEYALNFFWEGSSSYKEKYDKATKIATVEDPGANYVNNR